MKNGLSSRESGRVNARTWVTCACLAFLTVLVVCAASSRVAAEGPGGLLPPLYDAGDYRWYFDEKLPLLRVANEFVVGLAGADGADAAGVIDALTGEGNPLQGFRAEPKYGNNILSFVSPTVDTLALENALTLVADWAGVEWTSPLFWGGEGAGGPLIVPNEVVVALDMARASMDLTREEVVEGILEPDVISYRHLRGSRDQFILELADGGTSALAAAERYEALDVVRWADPNYYFQVIECYTPNDTLYGHQGGSPPAGPVIPSSSTVPEPVTLAVLFLGSAALLRRRP